MSKAWGKLVAFATQGNPTVKAGVVVLFFGISFLLKYAADNSLLSIETRLLGVMSFALALLALGYYLIGKNAVYALIVQGLSVGIMYLTTFTAFKLYDVLSVELGFVLLVAIMALSIFLAVRQDSKALAIAGIGGGFLAPILASTGEGNHIILFSYYAILNASILAIAWFKSWRILNLLGFFMTFVIAIFWGVLDYTPAKFASTEFFLILFFLFYVSISILHALKQPPNLTGIVDGTLLFGLPIVASSIQAILTMDMEYGMAISATTLGVFYALLHLWVKRQFGDSQTNLTESFFALSVIFFTIAIPLAVSNEWSTAAWAIEGAGVIWISLRQQHFWRVGFGLIVLMGASLLYIGETLLNPQYGDWLFANAEFIGGTMMALSALLSAYFFSQAQALPRLLSQACIALLAWGLIWWFSTAWRDFAHHLSYEVSLVAQLLHLAVSASLILWWRQRISWPVLSHLHVVWLALLALFTLLALLNFDHVFQNGAGLAWLLNFTLFYVSLYRQEQEQTTSPVTPPWLHSGALGVIAVLLIEQAQEWSHLSTGYWLHDSGVGTALVLTGLLLLILKLKTWPLSQHRDWYGRTFAWPIVILLLLWNLSFNVVTDSAGWSAYIPLLNPIDLMSIMSFAVIFFWWREFKPTFNQLHPWPYYFVGASAFIAFNAFLIRAVSHYGDIPYELNVWMVSIVAQATLSIAWSLAGVLVIATAHKLHQRTLWMVGSGLLALVVLKIFLIDLASSGSVARIISFIGVGSVLMAVGYFYPIPPSQESENRSKNERSGKA